MKPWENLKVSPESVKALWAKFDQLKNTAQPYEFPSLLMVDLKMKHLYEDLLKNWDEYNAQMFTFGLETMLTKLGYLE